MALFAPFPPLFTRNINLFSYHPVIYASSYSTHSAALGGIAVKLFALLERTLLSLVMNGQRLGTHLNDVNQEPAGLS